MAKPKIAFELESKARKNIERKIEALKSLIESGARPPLVPRSLRQFNSWKRDNDERSSGIEANANETLFRHSDLRDAAVALIQLIRDSGNAKKNARDLSVQRMREHANIHLAIRQIAEAALLRERAINASLRQEIEALRAQVASIAEEAGRQQSALEVALEESRATNAHLVRTRGAKLAAVTKND